RRRFKAFKPYAEAMDLLLRAQLPDKAAEQLKQAVAIDGDFLEAQFALGQALSAAGHSRLAGDAYVKAEQMSVQLNGSHHLQALVSAGIAYDDATDHEAAQRCFLEAEKWGANDALALVGRVLRLSFDLKHDDELLQTAEEAARRGGHLWETHFALGMVHYLRATDGFVDRVSGSEASAAALRKALALAPRQAQVHEWLAAALSLVASTPERIAEVKAHVDRGIELQSHDGNRRVSRAHFAGMWGEDGEADIAAGMKLGAAPFLVKLARAKRESESGNFAATFKLYSEILELTRSAPLHVPSWVHAGIELKRYDEVLPVFERWAKARPHNPSAFWLRALLSERKDNDRKAAIRHMREGLKVTPHNLHLHTQLARMLCDNGEFDEAVTATGKAIELSLENPLLCQIRLHSLKQLNRFDEARAYLKHMNVRYAGQLNDFDQGMAHIDALEKAFKKQATKVIEKAESQTPPQKAESAPSPAALPDDNPFAREPGASDNAKDNPFKQ
ncbi:MAG TPA: hypothetical protein VEJ63_03495, partial [Planctomycetota bacterium]|nr:hypothetical protein [Planctomycetota bacterium]